MVVVAPPHQQATEVARRAQQECARVLFAGDGDRIPQMALAVLGEGVAVSPKTPLTGFPQTNQALKSEQFGVENPLRLRSNLLQRLQDDRCRPVVLPSLQKDVRQGRNNECVPDLRSGGAENLKALEHLLHAPAVALRLSRPTAHHESDPEPQRKSPLPAQGDADVRMVQRVACVPSTKVNQGRKKVRKGLAKRVAMSFGELHAEPQPLDGLLRRPENPQA